MAQFDVHHNKGRLRDDIPFVVVVQSAQFDSVCVFFQLSNSLRKRSLTATADAWWSRWYGSRSCRATRPQWVPG